jgi:DNA-directed RNA polymerase specialized sigma24 family protein
MPPATTFAEFVGRIRAGDEAAAVELVRKYEGAIRREVRMRLNDPRLQRVLDSMDVCQSVLASFFIRAAAGQYDLEKPEQLCRLLITIARNKVVAESRRQRAGIRDNRRNLDVAGVSGWELAGSEPSPSRVASGRELLEQVRRHLSDEERRLAELRAEGREWAEIAAEVGGTAQARRKQFARAIDRAAREIGLEGHGDE